MFGIGSRNSEPCCQPKPSSCHGRLPIAFIPRHIFAEPQHVVLQPLMMEVVFYTENFTKEILPPRKYWQICKSGCTNVRLVSRFCFRGASAKTSSSALLRSDDQRLLPQTLPCASADVGFTSARPTWFHPISDLEAAQLILGISGPYRSAQIHW